MFTLLLLGPGYLLRSVPTVPDLVTLGGDGWDWVVEYFEGLGREKIATYSLPCK